METQELLYMIATIMVNQMNIIICFLYIKMKLYVIRSQVIVHCVVDGIILTTPSTYLTVRKISSGRLVRNFTKMGEWSVRSQVADTGDRNVRLDDQSSFGKLGSNGFQGHEVTTVLHRRRVEATGLDLRVEYTVGKKNNNNQQNAYHFLFGFRTKNDVRLMRRLLYADTGSPVTRRARGD